MVKNKKEKNKNKRERKSTNNDDSNSVMTTTNNNINDFLFRRGNVGLARLLVAVMSASPEGITTTKLLHQLKSTNHAQAFIRRAEREGLIERIVGESEHGHFRPVLNIITPKGKNLLQESLSIKAE